LLCCSGAARLFYFLNFWGRLCHPFGPNVTTLRNRESGRKFFLECKRARFESTFIFARDQFFPRAAQAAIAIFISVFSGA